MPTPVPTSAGAKREAGVSPADSAVLRALLRYHYLTAAQACRLLYSPGSLTYVQTRLKRLAEAGYCQRLWLPRASQNGSAPSVYALARRGFHHLHSLGLEVERRFRPAERSRRSYPFLNHMLTLNDFLIGAELLARASSRLALATMLHEQDLKRQPLRVEAAGERISVVPDAWLDLRLKDAYQVCLLVELDIDTEEQKAWRRKVRGLLAIGEGAYQERFGTTSLTIAVVVAAGAHRLRELLRWTEAELESAGEAQQASLFLFTACTPSETAPETRSSRPAGISRLARMPWRCLTAWIEEWLMPTSPRPAQLTLGSYGPAGFGRLVLGPELVATHKHVMGLTGQGKSKLLASIFVQLHNQGTPVALVDPHGDLALDVLTTLIDTGYFRSPSAYDRLLYVDFSDRRRFLPFNVLKQPYPPHDVARHIVEACKRVWPALSDGSAPQFENILLAGSLVLVENGLPLTEMPRLLTDKRYRDGLLQRVGDAAVVDFFRGRFDQWSRGDAAMMIESTLRRVFLLTFSMTLRHSLGHADNALDFRRLMDERTSLIFNLGGIDEETQRMLGSLITVGFEVAALSRADTPLAARSQYHLIIDEFSQFSAQSEEALSRVLSLARKYGLYLTLAHQTWSQLSSRLQGAMQNAVEIAFKLGRSDAEWAAPRFGRFDPYVVKHMVSDELQADRVHPLYFSVPETFEAWAQALTDLQPRECFVNTGRKTLQIKSLAVPAPRTPQEEVDAIIERYAAQLLRPPPSLTEQPQQAPIRRGLSRAVAIAPDDQD